MSDVKVDSSYDLPERIQKIYSSCTEEEQGYLLKILQELSEFGESETYKSVWLADYKEIPVDIDTFISSDAFLGKTNRQGEAVYPFWKEDLRKFFGAGNQYYEWILTGATRIGKTSTAITAAIYLLYKVMCLRDPQEYFQLKDISKISFLFFNITKDLAKGVAYREFNDTLFESPWFQSHGTFSRSERDFYYIPEGGKIVIDYGSDASHGLGQQVYCCVLDETNFSRAGVKDVKKAKAHMRSTYNIISTRMKGTFKHGGEIFGKIFAVSSKRSDSDFMEAYVKEQLDAGAGDHMYITDAAQWEVFPEGRFKKETFYIAIGDRYQKGFVVPDNQCFPEALNDLKLQGFRLLEPPIDMKSDFIADFHVALRDLAGIAVVGALSFITQDTIDACINHNRRNPFYSDILQIGTKDSLTLEEFFHLSEVPTNIKRSPLYIHLDLSLNTDRTGISGVGIIGRKDILASEAVAKITELTNENVKKVSQPCLSHAFSLAVEAPRGDKIPYAKIVSFICWLRKSGFNIQRISRDQYQSEYLAQLLEAQGFIVDTISLDRTPDGYIALRSVFMENRIDLLDHKLLQDELVHLQRDAVTGKIDHPVGGSKDVSDSLGGAVWNATMNNPGISLSGKSLASTISSVNKPRNANIGASQLPSMFPGLYNKYKK